MSIPLQGRRIVVPESRELDLFAAMLERQGAVTVRCPLVAICDVEGAGAVEGWLGRLAAGAHDDLVLHTGEGVTRLIGHARRIGAEESVIEGMRRARKIIRGPKPARALRQIGLTAELVADEPTTDGLIATMSRLDLRGRTIGVQLYPEPNEALVDFIGRVGGRADPVLPYRYASDEEDAKVADVLLEIASGRIDLIAFTSTPQVKRLQQVAKLLRIDLTQALARTRIAAVGPVTAEAIQRIGARVTVTPELNFHLKPLVAAIVAELGVQSPNLNP